MCTASIWHMCTMSMDRYFTLKYPMKYGRNKTKMTVALKILFVWLVSITISSPICVYGISDTNSVFNHGQCVPAIRDFVIYGSIFAFYIPLTIMLITYILTIRILWKNQKLMKTIDRSDLKTLQKHSEKCELKTLLCPPSDDKDKSNALSDSDPSVLGTLLNTPKCDSSLQSQTTLLPNGGPCSLPNPSASQKFHSKYSIMCVDNVKEQNELDMVQIKPSNPVVRLRMEEKSTAEGDSKLDQKASSMLCLKTLADQEPSSYSSICRKPQRSYPLMSGRGDNFLRINSNDSLVKRSLGKASVLVHQAVSCSTVNTSNSIISNLVPCSGNSHFHSCSDIGKKDLKLVEWKENYSKIQKEMDQILKGDFDKDDFVCNRSHFLAQVQSSKLTPSGSEESVWSKEIHEEPKIDDSHQNSADDRDNKGLIVKHLQQISDNSEKHACDDDDSCIDELTRSDCQLIPRTEASQQFTMAINNNNHHTAFSKCVTETSLLNVQHVTSHGMTLSCPCGSRKMSQSSIDISTCSRHSTALSESGDSLNDPSETSESSECLTIKLRPDTLHMCSIPNQKSSSPSTPLLGSRGRLYNGSSRQLCNGTSKHHSSSGHELNNGVLKTHTIHRLLSRLNKSQRMMPVMSKRATTNERKASKVLGIIFAVFVILWTPFFTVNILSVTCEHCMQNVTPELMSVFVWMGYTASLANPIIYTMFNTAFRRAFIRILKCHICINGSLRAADRSTVMSYPMSYTERKRYCGQVSMNHHSPL